jgi:hypothetical protein
MDSKQKRILDRQNKQQINVACLIHGDLYNIKYVDHLYSMIQRNLRKPFTLHVFTEAERVVPDPYVKHSLTPWHGIGGPKSSWWYKVQLFDPKRIKGSILYFDLDTVIVGDITWITEMPTKWLWAVKDFKHLFKSRRSTINSSVMWFDTAQFAHVLGNFNPDEVSNTGIRRWHGDQDYIDQQVGAENKKYLDETRILSWKWQVVDGGWNFKTRKGQNPGTGTILEDHHSVYVFHGSPKPHETIDKVIRDNWK